MNVSRFATKPDGSDGWIEVLPLEYEEMQSIHEAAKLGRMGKEEDG